MPPEWLAILAMTLHHGMVERLTPGQFRAGTTENVVTFSFDDAHLLDPRHHDAGAVWVTPNAQPGMRLPLFIYLHGLNRDRILRRWLHGSHWDMRTIVGPMVTQGLIGPMAVAVPATTGDSAQSSATIYPRFDVAAFVEAADRALAPHGFHIDRERVIFSSHSASGCALHNGLFAAVGSPAVQTVLDIDCCMNASFARVLALAPPHQRVIVAYQSFMWNNGRSYGSFAQTFLRLSQESGDPMNRALEHYEMAGVDVHNDIVPLVLRRWLPELVPPVMFSGPSPSPRPADPVEDPRDIAPGVDPDRVADETPSRASTPAGTSETGSR